MGIKIEEQVSKMPIRWFYSKVIASFIVGDTHGDSGGKSLLFPIYLKYAA